MIFEFLLILFSTLFVFSSLAVSVFHLSQFLGVLPVTDLALILDVSTNIIRQSITFTFFLVSLSGIGLALCTFYFIISQTSRNREYDSFIRRVTTATKRFEPTSDFYQMFHHCPISLPFPLIFLLLILCAFSIISIVLATFIGLMPTEARITVLSLVPLVNAFQFIIVAVLCFVLFRILQALRGLDSRLIIIEMNRRSETDQCYVNLNHDKTSVSENPSLGSVCEAPGVIF
ncbi:hypothetical protein PMAYCL1PPCAC_04519, partial [Pristionchus mayeri]